MKKVLIINGHPDPNKDRLCNALANAYEKGCKASGAETKKIDIVDLKFDPILHQGYKIIQPLESDLVLAQEQIKWADHIVFVFPTWWMGLPALMKGFVDRAFLPAFGFKYHKDSPLWDKLLKGKSARMLITMDAPLFYNWLVYKNTGHNAFKKGVLYFCGIKPVKTTVFDRVRFSSEDRRAKWLQKAEVLGKKLK